MSGPTTPDAPRPGHDPSRPGDDEGAPLADRLADLPVAEHAAVLEAEHLRLHRRLATIDQL